MSGGIDVRLTALDGKGLLTTDTPWGKLLLTAEPSRIFGYFRSVTNSGVQIQTIVPCPVGTSLYVTDIVISATKKANATVVIRFYDALTNTENIVTLDVNERGNYLALHPQGRTLGWDGGYIQLVTDTSGQAATCTVWYIKVVGDLVQTYAKWNAERGM